MRLLRIGPLSARLLPLRRLLRSRKANGRSINLKRFKDLVRYDRKISVGRERADNYSNTSSKPFDLVRCEQLGIRGATRLRLKLTDIQARIPLTIRILRLPVN
ncbi:hypothetical protein RSOLAG22IIIB_09862 [Rhizoctonia solani]|uniref:Uncharacterized protein n=1 Tax=Rhizoctonia solani TaxID=456999 RepID=A0A0K6FZV0_9AGAM|nr:hypothetical protein RSOLAG22IIIB_09862 [Rhizoctonia solani]